MKKIVLMMLMAVSAHASINNLPSNSVSLLSAVDTAQTIIFVPTTTPVPSGAYGASIISGNVPYNSGLDQYIEPIWVSSGNNNSITVTRGTRATANPQGTWTVYSQQKGLIVGHTIRTLPRLLYYSGTATRTPTFTATPTATTTPTSTSTQTRTVTVTPTSTLAEGPVAVTTAGTSMQVTQNLHIPGTLFSDSITNSNNKTFFLLNSGVEQIGDTEIPCQIAGSSITVTGQGDFVTNCGGMSRIHNVISPTNGGDASSKTYTDALSGSAQPTPAPRRVGDIYVNSAGTTVYIGVSLTPVTGWLQVKP